GNGHRRQADQRADLAERRQAAAVDHPAAGEVGALVCLAAMAVALLLMLAPRQAATEPSLGGHIPH
ncbi:hypothetical protein, partial [Pseudomonas aeruginosa]